jgi:hypothetical protein
LLYYGAVIESPGEEQTGGDDGVKLEVYGKKRSLKGAELLAC